MVLLQVSSSSTLMLVRSNYFCAATSFYSHVVGSMVGSMLDVTKVCIPTLSDGAVSILITDLGVVCIGESCGTC